MFSTLQKCSIVSYSFWYKDLLTLPRSLPPNSLPFILVLNFFHISHWKAISTFNIGVEDFLLNFLLFILHNHWLSFRNLFLFSSQQIHNLFIKSNCVFIHKSEKHKGSFLIIFCLRFLPLFLFHLDIRSIAER